MSTLERNFQANLIKKIKTLMPKSIVMKTNPNYIQGIPDLLILYPGGWAALEVKNSPVARRQPNQEYYVDLLHGMSYAAFIYPENEKEVLREIQQSYLLSGNAQLSES